MKNICKLLLLVMLVSMVTPSLSIFSTPVSSHVVTEAEVMPPKRIITPTPVTTPRHKPKASRNRPVATPSPTVTKQLTSGGVWYRLRMCESGSHGLYKANTGNGYYGAYQFDVQTLNGLGYTLAEYMASPEIQDKAARTLQKERGWWPWPACKRKLGL